MEQSSTMAEATGWQRMVAAYRKDHRHPVNHVLHVYVGWPLCALGVIALPFRPICCLYGFLAGYAFMWTGHFVFERNVPTVFKHPTTPFVIGWEVLKRLVRSVGGPLGLTSRNPPPDRII